MRLLSCHIYGFGGISDFEYSFKDGINVIREDNGWGKSTFAAFIRVMLYGFDNEKSRDEVKNERHRYKPWTGESFGGELCVEAEGIKYRIRKSFATKSEKDESQIINMDTGLVMDDMPSYIGERIFKINSESFARTAFISQQGCFTEVNGNISAKLGNLVDNTDDINNYEKVMSDLKKELNSTSPTRSTGDIYKLNNEIAMLTQEIREKDNIEATLKDAENKKKELTESLNDNLERQKKIGSAMSAESEYQEGKARKEKYEALIKELTDREEELANINRYFPNGVPSDESVNKKIDELGELSQLAGQLDSIRLSREEKQDLEALRRYFDNKIPSEEDITDKKEKVAKINELREKIDERKMRKEEKERLSELKDIFKNGAPSMGEINTVQDAIADRTDITQIINQKETRLRMLCDREKEKQDAATASARTKKSMLLILSFILIAAGGAGAYFINTYVAGLAVLGIILFIMALVTKAAVPENAEMNEILETVGADKDKLKETNEIIDDFKANYPWDYVDSQLAFSVHEIKLAADEYKKLSLAAEKDDTEPLVKLLEAANDEIRQFVMCYEGDSDPEEKSYGAYLYNIEKNRNEIERLSDREARTEEVEVKYNTSRKKMEAFILSNAIKNDDYGAALKMLAERIEKYKKALDEKEKAKDEKELFEKENPDHESLLALSKPEDNESLTNLDEERNALDKSITEARKHISDYEKIIDDKLEILDEISDKEVVLAEKTAIRDELKKKHELKSKTAELLEKAKITFSNKYANPVKDAFIKYYSVISEDEASCFNIDANIALTKDAGGHYRNTELLSRGQQDRAGICMRMGLVEAMYQDEKPFLIFDDPFTNLDDNSLVNAKKLMNKISENYQLIYFTCSNQRNI